MNKPTESILISTMTSNDYFPKYMYGAEVPSKWLEADWWEVALIGYPILKLKFDRKREEDWLLYRQIEEFSTNIKVPIYMAVHWAARKALGEYFVQARQMDKKQIPWNEQLRYVCRRYSLQLCKFEYPNNDIPLGLVDHMIYPMLLPDEELIYEIKPKNGLHC